MTNNIVSVQPTGGALDPERYQTFELAKENDTVLGGDDMAQIRSYSAFARARAQAIHKTIATMGSIDNVAATKAEMNETAQTFAKVSIYADQRIGELLRELPKAKNQHDTQQVVGTPTSTRQAERESGIGHATAIDLQKLDADSKRRRKVYGSLFFARLYSDLNDRFGVSSYEEIRAIDFNDARDFIREWKPMGGVDALKREAEDNWSVNHPDTPLNEYLQVLFVAEA